MSLNNAEKAQFMGRVASFSTRGSRNGANLLGWDDQFDPNSVSIDELYATIARRYDMEVKDLKRYVGLGITPTWSPPNLKLAIERLIAFREMRNELFRQDAKRRRDWRKKPKKARRGRTPGEKREIQAQRDEARLAAIAAGPMKW